MRDESTRASLLERVRDPGDARAWSEFESRYRGLIVAYARRRGLQLYDAEDVAQLVLLALVGSLRGFRYEPSRGRFRDYLGRVVRNAVTRFVSVPPERRRTLSYETLGGAASDLALDTEQETEWEEEWVRHHLRRALDAAAARFEPDSLAVFQALLDGVAPADVAAERGTTVDAVYKVRTRVREFLEAEVARQVADEELG